MAAASFGIHWFRRDLRVAGNENLRKNWKLNQGRVLGIFCFDSVFLKREDFSHNRFGFFLNTLAELKKEMQLQGGDLLVVDSQPLEAFQKILAYFKKNNIELPSMLSFGADYEPFARERDQKIKDYMSTQSVCVHSERDHLLIEPQEILKDDRSFYQVYSPYAKKWFAQLSTAEVQDRIKAQSQVHKYYERLQSNNLEEIFKIKWSEFNEFPLHDRLNEFLKENQKKVSIPLPPAGFAAGFERLLGFSENVKKYNTQRDFPYLDGTSMMSIYQKNGSIVSSQILATLKLNHKTWGTQDNSTQYVKEIAWREFYYSILYHRPDVEKQSFLPQYQNLKWQNNEKWFEKWCKGETGFPIVDAGMRQLNSTGWMHNRVRMIVASFLVKDLLIDWRWGENYFMKMLLDGDLAPNNGGWQWAASTGCDPQPYFRIFNPWLQAEKFDPEAKYIKTYIPELKNLSASEIHDPEAGRSLYGYPAPLVEHSEQKKKAVLLFQEANKK